MKRRGNTLIELLLSIFVFALSFTLLGTLITSFKTNMDTNSSYSFYELQTAFTQMRNEITSSNLTTINTGNILSFKNSKGEIVAYKLYGDRVIRQVNGAGYVVLLFNIKSFRTFKSDSKLFIEVMTIGDNYYVEEIVFPNVD
ncbi:MAG: putative Competence protein ComGF [Bacillales bacterium]|jgi:competence protein ComGF|nr:putative Competence protein ComGF [Bacillales bacterium]